MNDQLEVHIPQGPKLLGDSPALNPVIALAHDSAKCLIVYMGLDGTLSTQIKWEYQDFEVSSDSP